MIGFTDTLHTTMPSKGVINPSFHQGSTDIIHSSQGNAVVYHVPGDHPGYTPQAYKPDHGGQTSNNVLAVNNHYSQAGSVDSGYNFLATRLENLQNADQLPETEDKQSIKGRCHCCRNGPRAWCKKYFWEGQDLKTPPPDNLSEVLKGLPWWKRVMITQRRLVGFLIPTLFYHFFYWGLMIHYDMFYNFVDKYALSITMIFGSIIAGMTSEGGGAIAFPVMTLVLEVDPSVARDVSMMIQGSGMSCASFTILFMGVRIEWHSLILSSIGGIGGMIFGLHVVDPALSDRIKKLGFVSIWFAFSMVLIFLNRTAKRRTFKTIQNFNWWKGLLLVVFGFIGGIFTSFAGSGLDICSFMILTLLFRVSEKVATPTSVILMAFNSLVGIYWRGAMQNAVERESWEYISVVGCIVTIGAPVGSILGTHFHRLTLAAAVIIIDTIALIAAFAILPLTPAIIGGCVGVVVGLFLIFLGFSFAGQKLLNLYEEKERQIHLLGALENEDRSRSESQSRTEYSDITDNTLM